MGGLSLRRVVPPAPRSPSTPVGAKAALRTLAQSAKGSASRAGAIGLIAPGGFWLLDRAKARSRSLFSTQRRRRGDLANRRWACVRTARRRWGHLSHCEGGG